MKRVPRVRRGMTLVELIVVLAILVALAGTALLATEGIVDQGRRDATVRSLEALREAVIGREGLVDANDNPWVRGFVADMGRLPRAEESGWLNELWTPPSEWTPPFDPLVVDNALFDIKSPSGDPDVQVAVGWRGPYLRLPIGQTRWLDGWGNEPVVLDKDGISVVANSEIAQVISLGADGLVGGTGYDADLSVTFHSTVVPVQAPVQHGDVPVRVTGLTPLADEVVIRVYGPVYDESAFPPEEGKAGTVLPLGIQVDTVFTADAQGVVSTTFEDVPIGPRVLRAYVIVPGSPPASKDDPPGGGSSPVRPIMVVAGGLQEVVIDMGGP